MKTTVGVFFGGKSVEHDVSIITAIQVMNALDSTIYEVIPVYVSRNGDWYTGEGMRKIETFQKKDFLNAQTRIHPAMSSEHGVLYSYPGGLLKRSKPVAKLDAAFMAFHGSQGENGSFQGVMEIMQIPYVGSGVKASAMAMDKSTVKDICRVEEIAVVPSVKLQESEWYESTDTYLVDIRKMNFPLIVKPNDLGSSIGISMVKNEEELQDGIDLAFQYSKTILVEQFVKNMKEVNCSVAKTIEGVQVSELEELVKNPDNLVTFDDKYVSDGQSEGMASAKRIIPANLDAKTADLIRDYSRRIYNALDCDGLVRIDYMIDTVENTVFLNEINSIPGSLAFYLWEPLGVKFSQLLDSLIKRSMSDFAKKQKLRSEYKSTILSRVDGYKLSNKV